MPTTPWKYINRCVVCGSKLRFTQSILPKAKPEEGNKSCSHNHKTFRVHGAYDSITDVWYYIYEYPR